MALAHLAVELHAWASISSQAQKKKEPTHKMCVCACVCCDQLLSILLNQLSLVSHPSVVSLGFCKESLKYVLN